MTSRRLPLPVIDHTGGHKRSQYHPQIGWEICQRMCDGLTIAQIAADPDMPSYATIFHWRKVHWDFAAMYDACRDTLRPAALGARQVVPAVAAPGGLLTLQAGANAEAARRLRAIFRIRGRRRPGVQQT